MRLIVILLLSLLAASSALHSVSALRSGCQHRKICFWGARDFKLKSTATLEVSDDKILIPPSYNFAAGCWAVAGALSFGLHVPLASIPFVLLGALLTIQTGRVRFSFDSSSMEVLKKQSDGEITKSGENFAVGGENRWAYSSFKSWNFIPNENFPLFMYFKEDQTPNAPPDGQFHLFPMIMSSSDLGKLMRSKVGKDKQF